jgi:hypothetical protein
MELKLCTLVTTQTTFLEREAKLLQWLFAPSNLPFYDLYSFHTPRCKQPAGANRCREITIGLHFLTFPVHYNVQRHISTLPVGSHCACSLSSVVCAFLCRAVEVEIQLLDRPLTGLRIKVVEEVTPSLTPVFREGRAMSPVLAARFFPQQVQILNWLRNASLLPFRTTKRHPHQCQISTLCLPFSLIFMGIFKDTVDTILFCNVCVCVCVCACMCVFCEGFVTCGCFGKCILYSDWGFS